MPASRFLQRVTFAIAIALWGAGPARAATLVPDFNFGGGDGWRAPFETLPGDAAGTDSIQAGFYNYLGNTVTNTAVNAGHLERGMAYNPATGHLILVSRNNVGGTLPSLRILDGTTGVDLGALDQGTGVISGGNFLYNMAGVGDDGAIYVANLATNTTTNPFKIYRWENESATPTLAYSGLGPTSPLDGSRLGDTFDVIGSGANTRFVAGYSTAGGQTAVSNGFALFTTGDGLTYSAANVTLSPTEPAIPNGEFRLGITFQDSDTVIGKSTLNAATVVNLTGAATGEVSGTFSTDGITLRPMDFAMVGGKPIVAMVEATGDTNPPAAARIFVYDMSDLSLPLAERKIGQATALPAGGQFSNGNAVGQVKFGAINNNVATIYAMSTNNGIEAFTLTLDLPAIENADFDGDDDVDGADFLTWQANYGTLGTAVLATGDANDDGDVNDADFGVWADQFGTTGLSAAGTTVPEPGTAALATALAVCVLRRRRS